MKRRDWNWMGLFIGALNFGLFAANGAPVSLGLGVLCTGGAILGAIEDATK